MTDLFENWELPLLYVYKRVDELYTISYERKLSIVEIVENQHYRIGNSVDYFPKSNKIHLLKTNAWKRIKDLREISTTCLTK